MWGEMRRRELVLSTRGTGFQESGESHDHKTPTSPASFFRLIFFLPLFSAAPDKSSYIHFILKLKSQEQVATTRVMSFSSTSSTPSPNAQSGPSPSYKEVINHKQEMVAEKCPTCSQTTSTFVKTQPFVPKKENPPITSHSVPRELWSNGQCRTWLVKVLIEFCYKDRDMARFLVDNCWRNGVRDGGKDLYDVNQRFWGNGLGIRDGDEVWLRLRNLKIWKEDSCRGSQRT
jgi:hypothetical protein